jgi:hypothetical protein
MSLKKNKIFQLRKQKFDKKLNPKGKKLVIAFALWGDKAKYNTGAIENAKLAKIIYPKWECWFYVGSDVPQETISKLNSFSNVKLIFVNEPNNWTGMFWRFYCCSDSSVKAMMSRDCDSRLNFREKYAVEEWLLSDKKVHIMRDSWMHQAPMLGGMWGAKYPIFKNMVPLINDYSKGDFWQVDQNFLRDVIFPMVGDDGISHDELLKWAPNPRPFPRNSPPRSESFFVGQAYNI